MYAYYSRLSFKALLLISLVAVGSVSISCGKSKCTNCREIFDKYYEVNIQAFIRAVPDGDSVTLRRQAEYILNRFYEIDSTFIIMKERERNKLSREHQYVFDEARKIE